MDANNLKEENDSLKAINAELMSLVSAAPEMLAALEMVMSRYSKHMDGFAFEQCHAAIAKAIWSAA